MQVRKDSFRKSGRCLIDSASCAHLLWQRVKPLLPAVMRHDDGGRRGNWEPVGLNERLRFLQYTPGDYFKPHCDGSFAYPPGHPRFGERSLLTLMVYLNAPEKGGETNFLNEHDESRVTAVTPDTGVALIFEHELWHEGALLKQGTKFAIRTDVMFRPYAPTTTPADVHVPPPQVASQEVQQTNREA